MTIAMFVWKAGDAVGLCILGLVIAYIAVAALVELVQRAVKSIKERMLK